MDSCNSIIEKNDQEERNLNNKIGEPIQDKERVEEKTIYHEDNMPGRDLIRSTQWERKKLPRIVMSKGGWYEGEWLNGMRDGFGVHHLQDGGSYEGFWKLDKREGKGKLSVFKTKIVVADGEVHALWANDQPNGLVLYQHAGTTYQGEWINNLQHGKGVETWPDGSQYEGYYQFGKKSGKGQLLFADKSVYEGDFVDNYIKGQGKYTWHDGKIYEGSWQNNKMNGYGETIWPDGKSYKGNYVNDKKHGYGVFTWDTGKKYEGKFFNGKQHGEGVIITIQNQRKAGLWENGKQIKWDDQNYSTGKGN